MRRFKSLLQTHPELAKQWHPTKNGDLTPTDLPAYSDKRVWWICEKGHEWEVQVRARYRGRGYPYCARKKASEDYSLQIVNPELA
jgi:hypothetical protein